MDDALVPVTQTVMNMQEVIVMCKNWWTEWYADRVAVLVMNKLIWCVCTAVRKDDCMMLAANWWTEWCIRGYGQNDVLVDMDRMMMNNCW